MEIPVAEIKARWPDVDQLLDDAGGEPDLWAYDYVYTLERHPPRKLVHPVDDGTYARAILPLVGRLVPFNLELHPLLAIPWVNDRFAIADGWHRSQIAIRKQLPTVPVIVARPRTVG